MITAEGVEYLVRTAPNERELEAVAKMAPSSAQAMAAFREIATPSLVLRVLRQARACARAALRLRDERDAAKAVGDARVLLWMERCRKLEAALKSAKKETP